MFYSQFILAKKGPLGTIWIAAHLERKLRKNQVADTDIGVSVDSILFPDVPIALRLSSHLLLGVVRIYSRKVNYLFDDCSEALLQVKQAFRSTAVDLPPEESKAPYHSITLPETFELDDFELPDNDIFQGNYVDHHVSSREQITLQDSMEGVAYSTSKFGLDERFGDGDTSGLDLEEELFLDKVAATGDASVSADPQPSVEPMTPLKQDELRDVMAANSESMIDGAEGDADFMEYAQAPCTPGLAEEPNLSNIQETSACDDHLETEYQHLTESVMKEGLQNISEGADVHDGSCLQGHMPSPNDANPDAVLDLPSEENGCHSGNEQFPPPEVVFGCVPSDDHALASGASAPVDPVNAPLLELTDETAKASDDPIGEEHLENQIFCNDKVNISSHASFHEGCPSPIGTTLEENAHVSPGLTSIDLPQSNPTSPNIQESETCQEQSNSGNIMASAQIHILKPCNAQDQSDTSIPCCERLDPELPSDGFDLYRPENSQETLHASDPSTVPGEKHPSSDNLEQISDENHTKLPTSHEDNQTSQKSNVQVDEVISGDCPLENLCNSTLPDLPAPEILLSVPGGVVEIPRGVLVEDTPGDSGRINETDARNSSKLVSGRKRSYTESTLTEQSMNSFESSRMMHSQTTEFVPDDDDLLSSILVGKRSSALKLKPTPPFEITSVKRARFARTSTLKRKVLMDETMVLHGDTIRQQLTDTQDIRRVRKRAPCTCPEISVIQKQFMEDEIFSESILTGVSMELGCLHKQTFDLMGIKVLQNDQSGTQRDDENSKNLDTHREPLESATDPQGTSVNDENSKNLDTQIDDKFSGPDLTRENGIEGSDEPSVTGDDDNVKAVLVENKQGESYNLTLDDNENATQIPMGTTASVEEANASQLEPSENAVEKTNISLDDAENSAPAGVGSLYPNNGALGDVGDNSTELLITAPCDESKDMDAPMLVDEFCMSTDHVMGDQDVAMTDMSNDKLNASNLQEDNTVDITAVDSEPRAEGSVLFEAAQVDTAVEVKTYEDIRDVEYDPRVLTNGICGEQPTLDSSYSAGTQVPVLDFAIDGGEIPFQQETPLPSMFDAEVCGTELHDPDASNYFGGVNDTEFLNVDDDDDDEEAADDYMPDTEGARIADNSGWSSRTRAVAKYLQTVFTKETEYGRKAPLSIDSLLVGKTRKEASRMFFEALVLKTKDFVHVEQPIPFNDITIKPRGQLMKSDF
nr:sister chromatid cohesion 1 protein 4 isoform X1 [Ipomoea batatas]